ncbi:ABC-three component system middle component 1 [Vibrio parahaemolyticus]|uniref:ABC-three component system middle component 1 n=1 Tax=Vibrio parahaemolyticus TaxID=670 RepID=UPI003297BD3F
MKQKTSFEHVFKDISLDIKTEYNLSDLKFVKVNELGGMYVLFCSFSNVNSMEYLWKKISSLLASRLSKNLSSEFERWNVYLFLSTKRKSRPSIQYKIENDTFFCRKIVVNDGVSEFNNDLITKYIDEYIMNYDITFPKTNSSKRKLYKPQTSIYHLVDSIEDFKVDEMYDDLYNALLTEWEKK